MSKHSIYAFAKAYGLASEGYTQPAWSGCYACWRWHCSTVRAGTVKQRARLYETAIELRAPRVMVRDALSRRSCLT